ncbi:MAG: hypothetical protein ACLT9P_00670 [Evtepia gabavorous]
MKYQQWNIAQRSQEAYKAMERQGVPTLVAATLCARGMTDLAEAKGLLSSGEDQLQDPFLMKDMDLATARIGRALRNGEKIAVYGDYDVDASPPPVCSPIISAPRAVTCATTSPTACPRATGSTGRRWRNWPGRGCA